MNWEKFNSKCWYSTVGRVYLGICQGVELHSDDVPEIVIKSNMLRLRELIWNRLDAENRLNIERGLPITGWRL